MTLNRSTVSAVTTGNGHIMVEIMNSLCASFSGSSDRGKVVRTEGGILTVSPISVPNTSYPISTVITPRFSTVALANLPSPVRFIHIPTAACKSHLKRKHR